MPFLSCFWKRVIDFTAVFMFLSGPLLSNFYLLFCNLTLKNWVFAAAIKSTGDPQHKALICSVKGPNFFGTFFVEAKACSAK
jgi:hypothetical protein